MRERLLIGLSLVALFLVGIGGALAVGSSSDVSVCATATAPGTTWTVPLYRIQGVQAGTTKTIGTIPAVTKTVPAQTATNCATSTLASSSSSTTAPPPNQVTFLSPAAGTTVSGVVPVRVSVPAGTDWVGLYVCGGNTGGEDTVADPDGTFTVLWDTTATGCANGPQTIDMWAFHFDGSNLGDTTETVDVENTATTTTSTTTPTPSSDCTNPTVPVPASGYHLAFCDGFDTLDRTVWRSHQWYEPAPQIDSQTVDANGILHLTKRQSEGWANTTLSTEPSSIGATDGHDFQYGYFEARMQWDPVKGNGPAFWLLSTRHAMNPDWPNVNTYCLTHGLPIAQCYSGELDVSEAYGGDPTVFTGTLHRNSCNCYGVGDTQTANSWHDMGMDMSGWHVVAALWTPTLISWYVDGNLVMTDPPYDSTPQPMHLLLYNWNTDWEATNTPNTQPTEDARVDWVRVWQP